MTTSHRVVLLTVTLAVELLAGGATLSVTATTHSHHVGVAAGVCVTVVVATAMITAIAVVRHLTNVGSEKRRSR